MMSVLREKTDSFSPSDSRAGGAMCGNNRWVLLGLLMSGSALAQVPDILGYQGRL